MEDGNNSVCDIAGLIKEARKAKEQGDINKACSIYRDIEKKDASNWEALFYSAYLDAMQADVKRFWHASVALMNSEHSILTIIKKGLKVSEGNNVVNTVFDGLEKASMRFIDVARNKFKGLNSTDREDFIAEYVSIQSAAAEIMYTYGDELVNMFGDEYGMVAVKSWKKAIDINCRYTKFVTNISEHRECIENNVAKIHKYDPDYKAPEISMPRKKGLMDSVRRLFDKLKAS